MAGDLTISRIRAYSVAPAQTPPARYTGVEDPTQMNLEIARVTLANGVEGEASFLSGWTGMEGGKTVREIRELSAAVLGRSVTRRAAITESLLNDAGPGPWETISMVDCAMWDAYARSLGQPLWQLLGGTQQQVAAYASTRAFLSLEEYLDDTRRFSAAGYPGIKFHMNTNLDFDLEMVDAVVKMTAGSGLRFMVDLEQQYSFDEALRLGETLDQLPFDWMEAPLPDDDLDAYVELNKAVSIDVLPAGNTLVGLENWREGLARGAWSRLRCDASNAGGITTVIKAMGLARAMDVAVELQSFGFQPAQHANLHLVLGLEGGRWFEHPAPHEPYDYATHSPLTPNPQGYVRASEGPGLGVTTDWNVIETDAFESFDTRG